MDNKLKPLREQIDAFDAQILELLNRRARIAQQVGHVKAETNAPVFRPERETQVLRRLAEHNLGPLDSGDVQTIFREVMSSCRALERRVIVAYLGPAGTFSEQAVYQQFGHAVEGLPCASIDEVFRAAEAGTADFGVVPVENSSEGAINRTRFAVVGRMQPSPCGRDQTSLVLAVPNRAGAVYQLLAPLATHGVSMTRFESRPARMGTWEYYFYVDIEGHQQDAKVATALA